MLYLFAPPPFTLYDSYMEGGGSTFLGSPWFSASQGGRDTHIHIYIYIYIWSYIIPQIGTGTERIWDALRYIIKHGNWKSPNSMEALRLSWIEKWKISMATLDYWREDEDESNPPSRGTAQKIGTKLLISAPGLTLHYHCLNLKSLNCWTSGMNNHDYLYNIV